MIRNYVDCAMDAIRDFNVFDIGLFKLCLISLGILIGVYANKPCKRIFPFIWITFIASYVFLVFRIFSEFDLEN